MDEVLQLLEVCVGDGQQVHDGHHLGEGENCDSPGWFKFPHLFLEGEGVLLAQPERRLELL